MRLNFGSLISITEKQADYLYVNVFTDSLCTKDTDRVSSSHKTVFVSETEKDQTIIKQL